MLPFEFPLFLEHTTVPGVNAGTKAEMFLLTAGITIQLINDNTLLSQPNGLFAFPIPNNCIFKIQIWGGPDIPDELLSGHLNCTRVTITHTDPFDATSPFVTTFRVGKQFWAEVLKMYAQENTMALILITPRKEHTRIPSPYMSKSLIPLVRRQA